MITTLEVCPAVLWLASQTVNLIGGVGRPEVRPILNARLAK
jgi:hypothetical protein